MAKISSDRCGLLRKGEESSARISTEAKRIVFDLPNLQKRIFSIAVKASNLSRLHSMDCSKESKPTQMVHRWIHLPSMRLEQHWHPFFFPWINGAGFPAHWTSVTPICRKVLREEIQRDWGLQNKVFWIPRNSYGSTHILFNAKIVDPKNMLAKCEKRPPAGGAFRHQAGNNIRKGFRTLSLRGRDRTSWGRNPKNLPKVSRRRKHPHYGIF